MIIFAPSLFFLRYTSCKLGCRRKAAQCFVFVCSQLQHTYSTVFLLLVTAASDLLVHKILLNSVLLSPIVSSGFQQKYPPGSVLRCHTAAEHGVMTKGLCPGRGVDLRLRPAYNVEPVTNTPSSSCANNGGGRRRECSARPSTPSVAALFFHTSRLVRFTTL